MGYWKNKHYERQGIWQDIAKWEEETETNFFNLGDVSRILRKINDEHEKRVNAEIAQEDANRYHYGR